MGIKIKDLPIDSRPREKAIRYGISSLSDEELLAIIIGSGSKNESALEIARKMINDVGSISNFANMSEQDLMKYDGVKNIKAMKISASLELVKRIKFYEQKFDEEIDTYSLYKKYSPMLAFDDQENLILVMTNSNKKAFKETKFYRGGKELIAIHPNEIIGELLKHNAKGFYLIHNHPSGNPRPSSEDILATDKIFKKAKTFKIDFLDHLIIAKNGCFSFQKNVILTPDS